MSYGGHDEDSDADMKHSDDENGEAKVTEVLTVTSETTLVIVILGRLYCCYDIIISFSIILITIIFYHRNFASVTV